MSETRTPTRKPAMDVIFITGHRKSGTSVFHKLFEGHPDLNSFPVDLSVFYAYFPGFASSSGSAAEKRDRINRVLTKCTSSLQGRVPVGGTRVFDCESFLVSLHAGLADAQLGSRSAVLRQMLQGFATCCGFQQDRTWVVKETSQAIFAADFLAGDLNIRFINLLRDPRDNYAALKAGVEGYYSAFGEDEMKTLASLVNRARMDFLASETLAERFRDRLFTVRFEDLCTDTDAIMRDISAFCGIAFDQSLLSPTFLGESYDGNSHDGRIFRGLSSENVGRWPERISDREAMIIEFWMHDVMQKFGYQLVHDRRNSSEAFADFYAWYNSTYFFHDSFAGSANP